MIDMRKKAGLRKWIGILIFLLAIIFLALFTKNKGSISGVINDVMSVFR